MTSRDRFGAVAAVSAAVFNAAGVAPLGSVPGAYKPDTAEQWLGSLHAAPGATTLSATFFVCGVLLLVPASVAVGRRLNAWGAAALISAGAVLNAAGALLPIVVLEYVPREAAGAGLGLLGAAIGLDAVFNLCLGVGLVGFGVAALRRGQKRWGGLGILAGIATVPVAAQVVSRAAADWLAVAGPLWLIWWLVAGVVLARDVGE